jgi:hypothetical protein
LSVRSWLLLLRKVRSTFIAYAGAAHLLPVLVLHAALLPINVWRLWQCAIARTPNEQLRARFAPDPERKSS